ncbi:MAG: zf-HC2 domain-containing protein [Candidatus Sumerlaeaceae bacterium]|nr:zf-HC2 domain-containing protein [Candidatus Sumerlaeaceae bacterium]
MMTCEKAVGLVSEALDRELTPSELKKVRWHIRLCPACFKYEKQIQLLHDFCVKYGDHICDEVELPEEARTRIKAALESAGSRKE